VAFKEVSVVPRVRAYAVLRRPGATGPPWLGALPKGAL